MKLFIRPLFEQWPNGKNRVTQWNTLSSGRVGSGVVGSTGEVCAEQHVSRIINGWFVFDKYFDCDCHHLEIGNSLGVCCGKGTQFELKLGLSVGHF